MSKIKYKTGNILDEEAEALVNTVNCIGFMGRGIALDFKKAFPENFDAYAVRCKNGKMDPKKVFVFETDKKKGNLRFDFGKKHKAPPRYIINFPTKRHWRGKSKIEDIKSGLESLEEEIRLRKIKSIAIPPLGCGLGGLDWQKVKPLIQAAMGNLDDVQITVFEPHDAPADGRANRSTDVPKMTVFCAALVGLMDYYLRNPLDRFDSSVTLLEIHKLMYFMQVAGQSLKLSFVEERYGPYARNLRQALRKFEGHMVSGCAGSDAFGRQLELVPGSVEDAAAFLAKHSATHKHFDRVVELVAGFESPRGLELLSKVHWIACKQRAKTMDAIAERVYAWNEGKKRVPQWQIGIAAEALSNKGWMNVPGGMDRWLSQYPR